MSGDCGVFFFFKQKTAYEMRISDWSSDVCSSDLPVPHGDDREPAPPRLAVVWVVAGRTGAALTATEHVHAHDEPAVGVDGLAGPDDGVPPARGGVARRERAGGVAVAGEGGAQQAQIGRASGRERAGQDG